MPVLSPQRTAAIRFGEGRRWFNLDSMGSGRSSSVNSLSQEEQWFLDGDGGGDVEVGVGQEARNNNHKVVGKGMILVRRGGYGDSGRTKCSWLW